MDAKISIIITADGSLKELNRALDSICGQSLQELEIICVGSGFDEISRQRIQRYMRVYPWIRMLPAPDSTQGNSALLTGVMESTGEYIILLDPFTYFQPHAFKDFYTLATQKNADIIHFFLRTFPKEDVSPDEVDRFVSAHHVGSVYDENVLESAYLLHSFSRGIRDKMFRASILKKALQKAQDFLSAPYEEELLFFCIALFSKVYVGHISNFCVDYVLYSAQKDWMTEEEFNQIAGQLILCQSVCKILEENEAEKEHQDVVDQLYKDCLYEGLSVCINRRIRGADKGACFKRLIKYWGAKAVICGLAQWYFGLSDVYMPYFADVFPRNDRFKTTNTVGVFLSTTWARKLAENDFNVILFSYEKELVHAEGLGYTVVELPGASKESKFWYGDRHDSLCQTIAKYKVSLVIFDWCREENFCELLTVRSCGVKVCMDASMVKDLTNLSQSYINARQQRYVPNLIQSDVALLPKNVDYTLIRRLGVVPLDSDASAKEILQACEVKLSHEWDIETAYYESNLSLESYFQECMRFRGIVGPLKDVLFRPVDIALVQRGMRAAVFWQMLREASLAGKMKLLGKLVVKFPLKLLGIEVKLGIQDYVPKGKMTLRARIRRILWLVGQCLSHPCQMRLKAKEKFRVIRMREKYVSLGNENPDKTFYLIRLLPGSEGLIASYMYYLRELQRLENTNYIPVIDMRWDFYLCAHNDPSDAGKVNAWELYFQPVAGYSLEDIDHSKNVIYGEVGFRDERDRYLSQCFLREDSEEGQAWFNEWHAMDHKYMKLQPKLEMQFSEEFLSLIGDFRTIGVEIREGYSILHKLNYELIDNHPAQPEMEQFIEDIRTCMRRWNCDRVFVSTESQQTIERLQEAFGEKLIFTERKRKNYALDTPAALREEELRYYKQLSREQVNIDYLKEIYMLSRCTCLLAGRSNSVLAAVLWNGGQYEHYSIYDLGTYTVDQDKKMVSMEQLRSEWNLT